MLKRILISCIMGVFLCTGLVVAQPETTVEEPVVVELNVPYTEIIDKVPALKQGVIYSIDDQQYQYASTTELVEWKGLTLEGGYAIPDTLLGVVSYRIGSLKDLGVNVPLLNLVDVNVGYYIGWKDLNDSEERKFDHGISFTLLNIKF